MLGWFIIWFMRLAVGTEAEQIGEIWGTVAEIRPRCYERPPFTRKMSAVRARQRPPRFSAIFYPLAEVVARFLSTTYQSKAFTASAMYRGLNLA